LLRQYDLETSSSLRFPARSEAHELAFVRLRQVDVEALRRPPGQMYAPIVALFSTSNSREPVQLRANEAIYVQLPATDAEDSQGAEAAGSRAGSAPPARPTSTSARAWVALRVSAHHVYVTGMRVSGVMHRSIVRLERDKTL